MRTKISNNTRFVLITVFVVFFVLIMITPVSAELRTIDKGATIFIGENNLDITKAVGSSNSIGWWASAASVPSSDPIKTIDLAGKTTSFFVDPSDFVGHMGNWYPLNTEGKAQLSGDTLSSSAVFNVQDPRISVAARDFSKIGNGDVTGMSVMQGTKLGFSVDTNMYVVTNPQYRPNANTATDGYINIKWKGEDGQIQNNLLMGTLGSTTSTSTLNQYVNTQPWDFGTSTSYWVTDATDAKGQYVYPAGLYVFWAESKLNNMKDNYKNAGADYTGKTVSKTMMLTLISSSVSIQTNKDSVIRGDNQGFGIYIFAAPSSTYDLYINNGDVSGITPPTVAAISQYTFPLMSPGHYQIKVDLDGNARIPFVTSSQTTPRIYTFKLVDPKGTQKEAHVNVEVLAGVTPTSTTTTSVTTPVTFTTTQELVTTVTTATTVITKTTTGELTPIVTTTTSKPTTTINYSATIAAMQSQIAEQNAKIEEQGSWIDQILRFLGLK